MKKAELIDAMAGKTRLTKKDAGAALGAILDSVSGALAGGDRVQIIGFGTFLTSERPARKGRNPQTGKEIEIPASKAPVFRAGAALKTAVNTKDSKKSRKK